MAKTQIQPTLALSDNIKEASLDDESERLKVKEDWLREEIRGGRNLMFSFMRWGITVQTGVETALYFIRRDVMARHSIPAEQPFPFLRWVVGTMIQLLLAFIFWTFTRYVQKTHVNYRRQLTSMTPSYSGIEERPAGNKFLPILTCFLYFSFPIADLLLWLYLLALKEHSISISWKFMW